MAVALLFANMSLLPHYSRQKFIGFKVALDDEGTAEGWLFWDDGQSIGKRHLGFVSVSLARFLDILWTCFFLFYVKTILHF